MERCALVLGESLVDVVDGVAHAGGSPANVAVALARLGRDVRFATSWADDDAGALVAARLQESGVRLASDPRVVERTSRAIATLRPDGSADYDFELDWRLGPVEVEDPWAVHVGSFSAVLAPGADDVRREVEARRKSALVSYDINARPSVTGTGSGVRRQVQDLVAMSDLVKASDEDLETLWPELGQREAVELLLGLGAQVVVVTRGGDGAEWFTRDSAGDVAPVRVTVSDTIGAGDTFSAALLDALWGRSDLADVDWDVVVGWAVKVAAVTVSRPGADPPTRTEVG